MSRALEFLREGYQDPSMQAIKEWTGPSGEMGIYQSQRYRYTYLFVLVDADKRIYYQHQYTPGMPEDVVMSDAKAIAMFAGIEVEG